MKNAKRSKSQPAGLKAETIKRKKAPEQGRRREKPYRDTHMPSAGAENYVCVQLMFRDIDAFKCERGRAGIDVVAADTRSRTSLGIQVKSRYDQKADGFPIKAPKADFVVFARLNLDAQSDRSLPDCYVFPAAVVRRVIVIPPSGKWSKCHLGRIKDVEQYRKAWHLIANALKKRT